MNRAVFVFLSIFFLQLISSVVADRTCPQNVCFNERCSSGEDCYYDTSYRQCFCERGGMNGGAIAGIVIAAIVAVCICVACGAAFARKRANEAAYASGQGVVTTQYGAPVGAMYAMPAGQMSPGQPQYGYPQQPMQAIPVAYAQQTAPPAYGTTMEGQYYTGNPQETRAI